MSISGGGVSLTGVGGASFTTSTGFSFGKVMVLGRRLIWVTTGVGLVFGAFFGACCWGGDFFGLPCGSGAI